MLEQYEKRLSCKGSVGLLLLVPLEVPVVVAFPSPLLLWGDDVKSVLIHIS